MLPGVALQQTLTSLTAEPLPPQLWSSLNITSMNENSDLFISANGNSRAFYEYVL